MPRDPDTDVSSEDSFSDVPLASQSKGRKKAPQEYKIKHALKPPRTTTYTAQALYDQIVEEVIDLNPEYQREIVWSDEKQIGLIDSIFRNFYIPPLIFAVSIADDGSEKRVCIDGKQRLSSIRRFMEGSLFHRDQETKARYYYSHPTKHELPIKYKRLFANKQIVCIEYTNLTDDDEREIFRRVQLGMALTAAEKMKAEQKTERGELVTSLSASYTLSLEVLGFGTKRDSAYRWTAQSVYMITKHPHASVATTSVQLTKWLSDTTPVAPELAASIRETFQLLVDVLKEDKSCLHVVSGPTTIAPVDLVMMVLLVDRCKTVLKRENLGKAIRMLRTEVRKEFSDMMWKSTLLEAYFRVIQKLEREGDQVLEGGMGSQMDVDLPTQAQKNGGVHVIPSKPPANHAGPTHHSPTPPRTHGSSRLDQIRMAKAGSHPASIPTQSSQLAPLGGQPLRIQTQSGLQQYPPSHLSYTQNGAGLQNNAALGSISSPSLFSPRLEQPGDNSQARGNGSGRGSVERGMKDRNDRFHPYQGQDPRR